jgi:hypothetical protein
MAKQDPRDYRGGVHEPPDAKGGSETWADTEGIVPREMVDEPTADTSADAQELGDAVTGEVTDRDPTDTAIDTAGGDHADATEGTTGSTGEETDSDWQAANAAPGDTGRA